MVKCFVCETIITTGPKNKKYCSQTCMRKATGTYTIYPHLANGTVGALNELKVCVDLMDKGCEVYRALSPTTAYDLIIIYKGVKYSVEVKTAYRSSAGNIMKPALRENQKDVDILATVVSYEIFYTPDIFNDNQLTSHTE